MHGSVWRGPSRGLLCRHLGAEMTSVPKVKDGLTTDDLYGFLTTDPNSVVAPFHRKAMR